MASYLCTVACRQLTKRVLTTGVLRQTAAYHNRTRIGNRDVVGFGVNGAYMYVDRPDFPFPAIRFKENTSDTDKLREKEKNDWKNLTLDEKKTLYRHSFCLTYSEQRAPSGDWKYNIGGVLCFMGAVWWMFYLMKLYVYPPLPETCTPEHQAKMLERMIQWRANPIDGPASKWDYENNRWKE